MHFVLSGLISLFTCLDVSLNLSISHLLYVSVSLSACLPFSLYVSLSLGLTLSVSVGLGFSCYSESLSLVDFYLLFCPSQSSRPTSPTSVSSLDPDSLGRPYLRPVCRCEWATGRLGTPGPRGASGTHSPSSAYRSRQLLRLDPGSPEGS